MARRPTQRALRARALYQAGKTVEEIAQELGCKPHIVRKLLPIEERTEETEAAGNDNGLQGSRRLIVESVPKPSPGSPAEPPPAVDGDPFQEALRAARGSNGKQGPPSQEEGEAAPPPPPPSPAEQAEQLVKLCDLALWLSSRVQASRLKVKWTAEMDVRFRLSEAEREELRTWAPAAAELISPFLVKYGGKLVAAFFFFSFAGMLSKRTEALKAMTPPPEEVKEAKAEVKA